MTDEERAMAFLVSIAHAPGDIHGRAAALALIRTIRAEAYEEAASAMDDCATYHRSNGPLEYRWAYERGAREIRALAAAARGEV